MSEFDWDTPIKNDAEERTLFPVGTVVEFEVTKFEQARTQKNAPMAKLTLSCESEGNFAVLSEVLVLMASCEWKLCKFFTAIGQRKTGETLTPQWNKVEGSKGFAVLGIRTYVKEGKEHEVNEVTAYLEPEEGAKKYAADRPEVETETVEDNLKFD